MSSSHAEAECDSANDNTQLDCWWNIPISAYRRKALLRALSSIEEMKRRDDPQAASQIVDRQLDHHLSQRPVPPLISGFLQTQWRAFMTQLYFAEGDEGEAWSQSLENTDALTWSLQPKRDEDSRKRLYALLPDLVQWIHTVLEVHQVCDADEDAFFAELARHHVAALNPESRADTSALPQGGTVGDESQAAFPAQAAESPVS